MIHWDHIVAEYNRKYMRAWDEKQWIEALYRKFGTMQKTAWRMGVSYPVLRDRFNLWGIVPKGRHVGETVYQKIMKIPLSDLAKMTAGEIAKATNSNLNSVYHAIYQWKLPHAIEDPVEKFYKRDAIIALGDQAKDMTINEISETTKAAMAYVYFVVWKYGIEYKKKQNSKRFKHGRH